jgi:hypothetical protein
MIAAECAAELLELVGGRAAVQFRMVCRDFLQAYDIRVQSAQDVDDRMDANPAILAATPVNIPTDNAHSDTSVTLNRRILPLFGRGRSHGRIDVSLASSMRDGPRQDGITPLPVRPAASADGH